MNKQLRKRHRIVWLFISITLPVMLLISWLLIPQLEPVKAISINQPAPLPVILKTNKYPHYEVELQTNSNGDLQIEWWSKAALRIPTAAIYQLKNNGQQVYIGRIEGRGHYRFPLQKDSSSKEIHLQLYDFIHEQLIDTLNFSL
jgi:hypothetical protein